ncbi:cellobiose transport system substrate-binding protein [Enterococcus sp. AZ194]|uniref:ABC transporter substrate-binding protein n=1 Tax=Enterococcus sp. AZ194 TaxID=2774629 RepID=UPI003F24F9D4
MKKTNVVKLLGVSLLGCVLLAGCGSNSDSGSSGKVKLSVNYYNGAIGKSAMEAAKKEFPDYEISFKQIPANDDFDTKLKASLNSNSAPDITAINSNIQDYLPYADKFVNLKDYDTEALADQYVEWKWASCFTNDKKTQIAMPIDIGPTALFYNIAAFEAAGLPTDPETVSQTIKTEEDLMAAAKQMKEKADKPMFQSATALLQERTRRMTKHVYDENGELTFADGELKEAWDYVVEAQKNGYTLGIKANTSEGANSTQQGLFGSMLQASWGIADLVDVGVKPGEWLIAKSPGQVSNYGGSYLAVLKTTDHPKEAAEVIKFLTNEDNQRSNYEELSLFPSNKKVFDDSFKDVNNELFGDEKFNQYFIESANELKYVPFDSRETAAIKVFEDQMTLVDEQGKDPEKAWTDATKKVEEIS